MIYCQDCGAANDPGQPTCRVCGRVVQIEPSTTRCPICGEFVGIGAAFCSACGAASADLALGTHAEGGSPPGIEAIDSLIAATPSAARGQSPASSGTAPTAGTASGSEALNLSAGLELPNWLLRAAAKHPYDPNATDTVPAGFVDLDTLQAATVADEPVEAATVVDEPVAPASVAPAGGEPPLPPIPDGGLATSMPEWLKPGTAGAALDSVAAPPAPLPPAPAPPHAPPRGSVPAATRVDPADASSFISESDLPEWLRQLAANEAAQAEAKRQVEEEAALAAASAAAAVVEPEAPAPSPFEAPSEVPAPSAQLGGWLTRRDGDDSATGRRSAFAELVGTPDAAPPAATVPIAAAPSSATPDSLPSWADARSAQPTPVTSPEAADRRRWLLIGALLVAIVALLAYLYVSGSFS